MKKGFISIEVVIIAALVLLFGILAITNQSKYTDNTLDLYEARINKVTAPKN